MFSQGSGYHVGYETTKASQAELRALRAQDRLARQALAEGQGVAPSRLPALLRDARLHRWITRLGQSAISEPAVSRDLPTAPR